MTLDKQKKSAPEVYPKHFEEKIGFSEIKQAVADLCASALGREQAMLLDASIDLDWINLAQRQTSEMIRLLQSTYSLPQLQLVDCRLPLQRIRPESTYLEEEELADLRHMLRTLEEIHHFFTEETATGGLSDESRVYEFPELSTLMADCPTFPKVLQHLNQLLSDEGRIKDNATRELLRIRTELTQVERSMSGVLQRILRSARAEGWVETDVQPSLRDGRLVIPVAPMHKRKIKGIVHDESATGKTVYIEPVELVEANNRLRELEGEERRELIRILTEVANRLRPNISHLLVAYQRLGALDFILAKARWAEQMQAFAPVLKATPHIDWLSARHPLLQRSLQNSGRQIVPLEIRLVHPEGRILLISGPNAGGKSVCLKTVGLLQYMAQCGLPVPLGEASELGLFTHFFIDIGDEQSIEDDLSTYSSHLSNMKQFVRGCNSSSLLLIDEFGGGTEPTIGGAIAQALLGQFNQRGAFGVITTHYQNLKNFAEEQEGIVNGAMLYDRHEMRPLFRLSIGRPGSSFAIEIARKIGLPEEVIAEAGELVGTDYIDMDKYLQDIIRDKRYWETKRQNIRKEERRLQEASERYTDELERTKQERKAIIAEAKREAERIVAEANSRIERTIKDIREAEAERERTLQLRQELQEYRADLSQEEEEDSSAVDKAKREVEKLLRRRQHKAERKQRGNKEEEQASELLRSYSQASDKASPERPNSSATQSKQSWAEGDAVLLEGYRAVGTILSLGSKDAVVAIGGLKVTIAQKKLHRPTSNQMDRQREQLSVPSQGTRLIIDQIHQKRLHFKQDIDLRGMRAVEGIQAVQEFIDDAVQLGISRVRILHGTGTGALKEAVRNYLKSLRSVQHYADEHVQFGGAGITVVDLE